jgi:glutathione S-transferase
VRFTESPRHPHVGLKRANSPVGPKLKAHVEGSDAQQFIRAAAANNLDRLDAMLKVRPGLVAAPWSYGDARRALQYALMDRAPEMVRMLMRAVEEHSTRGPAGGAVSTW